MTITLKNRVTQTRLHNPPESTGNCMAACLASVFDEPIEAFDMDFGKDWWEQFVQLCLARGYLPLFLTPNSPTAGVPKGVSFADGKSPRGILHLCVAEDGVVVHDPHPSRAGLVSIDQYWVLVPWVAP